MQIMLGPYKIIAEGDCFKAFKKDEFLFKHSDLGIAVARVYQAGLIANCKEISELESFAALWLRHCNAQLKSVGLEIVLNENAEQEFRFFEKELKKRG